MKKRIIASALALALLCCLPLTGCTVSSETYASYDKYQITRVQYEYWLSYYKSKFYATFVSYGYVTDDSYTEDFWDTEMTAGTTLGQMVTEHVDSKIKEMLVCLKLFDDLEIVTSKDDKNKMKSSIQSYIDDDITAVGSRSELNRQLGELGLNINSLYTIYEIEAKCLLVENQLYGDSGTNAVTDTERENYYQDNFSRVKHILVDLNEKYVLDANGDPVLDTYTGYYKTEKLTDEEIAERQVKAQALYERAKASGDFEELMKEYNDDGGMSYYTDGYFVSDGSSFDEVFLNAALDMKVGDVRLVKSSYGMHIIKKYPLEAGMWGSDINKTFFSDLDSQIIAQKKEKDYGQYYSSIESDVTYHDGVNFKEIKMMSDELLSTSSAETN